MTPQTASTGFAAVGSAPRLQVLMALVRSGPDGLTTGKLQDRLGIPASTLAHHLRILAEAGVIRQLKRGRTMHNLPEIAHLQDLAEYLLNECCVEAPPAKHKEPANG
jgi:ArsR family transcriptional regulator, arsenate/arsenite/antimonite-responsive transcriptional repressor